MLRGGFVFRARWGNENKHKKVVVICVMLRAINIWFTTLDQELASCINHASSFFHPSGVNEKIMGNHRSVKLQVSFLKMCWWNVFTARQSFEHFTQANKQKWRIFCSLSLHFVVDNETLQCAKQDELCKITFLFNLWRWRNKILAFLLRPRFLCSLCYAFTSFRICASIIYLLFNFWMLHCCGK